MDVQFYGLPNTNDPGENDGMLIFIDNNELDGIFDIGDGCYGSEAEPLTVDFNKNQLFLLIRIICYQL